MCPRLAIQGVAGTGTAQCKSLPDEEKHADFLFGTASPSRQSGRGARPVPALGCILRPSLPRSKANLYLSSSPSILTYAIKGSFSVCGSSECDHALLAVYSAREYFTRPDEIFT